MRGNGGGAIIQMSSLVAVDVLAGNGAYAASKFTVEGMSVALAREMECFNVHVVILEPGPIKTGIDLNSRHSKPIATYEDMLASDRWRWVDGDDSNDTGDPAKCAEIVLLAADMSHPPLRLPLNILPKMSPRRCCTGVLMSWRCGKNTALWQILTPQRQTKLFIWRNV